MKRAACKGLSHLFFPAAAERPQARAPRGGSSLGVRYVRRQPCAGSSPGCTTSTGSGGGESEDERHAAGFRLIAPIGVPPAPADSPAAFGRLLPECAGADLRPRASHARPTGRRSDGGRRTPWVGQPYPLGATYDGSGTNFSLFTTVAEGGRAVPARRRYPRQVRASRRRSTRSASPSTRSTATAGTPTSRTSDRGSATGIASTVPGTRRRACGATRPSCCSTPTSRPSTARSTGTQRASATTSTIRRSRAPPTAPTCRSASSATRSSIGPTTGAAAPDARDDHLRDARPRPDDRPSGCIPEDCAAPTPASPIRS